VATGNVGSGVNCSIQGQQQQHDEQKTEHSRKNLMLSQLYVGLLAVLRAASVTLSHVPPGQQGHRGSCRPAAGSWPLWSCGLHNQAVCGD
jgi:hypothetical protein